MKGRKPNPSPSIGTKSHKKAPSPGAIAKEALSSSPPSWLSPAEAVIWARVLESAPAGILRAADEGAVSRLVVSLAAYEAMHEKLKTSEIVSKEYASLRRLMAKESELALRLEAELGIGSPTARRRVVAVPDDGEKSDFDRFIEKRNGLRVVGE